MVKKIPEGGYKDIFNCSPATILVMDIDAPFYTILDVNEAYLNSTNSTREELIGQSVFGAFPENPTDEVSRNIERTIFSFQQAIQTKKPHTMYNYRYDIPIRGTNEFEERWWTTTNTPILDENGEVAYFIHSPANVTELYKTGQREQAALAALKKQREQLYAVFMQAPLGIAIFRGANYITDLINPPFCELSGKTVDEMLGKPVFDVLTYARGIGFEELMDNVRLTGVSFKGNGFSIPLLRNGNLDTVYVNFVYEPYREDDGTITGVIAVAIEVTEQVNIKIQLEEAEERARLAVDAVGLGTFDLNLLNDEIITSATFANIFGFEQQVPRKKFIASFHQDDLKIRELAHAEAIVNGHLFYEARVIWPDKSVRWVRVEGKVYYNDTGQAARILGTLLDITEQKKSEEAIAKSEELFRGITLAAPACLWMADVEGKITFVNQAWIDWTGKPFEEHLGTGWMDFIIAEDREKAAKKYVNDLSKRAVYESEYRIAHFDGTAHWCAASGRPQYSTEGTFTGYIGACVDITEQKHLQQQKDDFIGIASHELKTPVTSIKAYAQVLEKMLSNKGETKEAVMINKMDKQLNRLTNLIADLLDVTKINSGKLQFNDNLFDFDVLVKELIEDLQRTAIKHTIVENCTKIGLVYGDRERIGQVIINLISNAIKYSPKSDMIFVNSYIDNNEVILSVQDFGIGISPDNLNKVFEQFYRVSGEMQHTFPGLGLGLYISSEIVKREGGRIWVKSKEGQGSTFYFALPLKNTN